MTHLGAGMLVFEVLSIKARSDQRHNDNCNNKWYDKIVPGQSSHTTIILSLSIVNQTHGWLILWAKSCSPLCTVGYAENITCKQRADWTIGCKILLNCSSKEKFLWKQSQWWFFFHCCGVTPYHTIAEEWDLQIVILFIVIMLVWGRSLHFRASWSEQAV